LRFAPSARSVAPISSSSTMSHRPVGAQEIDVAGPRRIFVDLGLDARIDAERLRDEVLVLRVLRLLER
jgi:hypothetical protein